MSESAVQQPEATHTLGVADLFLTFLAITLSGFGGVLPWARRALVDKKRWLTDEEFAEALALSQFLPGPNIVNLAIVIGQRYRGALGATAAALGLLVAPVGIMMVCGALYERYGGLPSLRNALAGLTAAAAGLLLAMVARLLQPLLHARRVPALLFAITAFVAVGLLRFPLYWVLLVLGPLSVAAVWWRLK